MSDTSETSTDTDGEDITDFGEDFGSDFNGVELERAEAAGLNEPGDMLIGFYLGYRYITNSKRKKDQQLHRFANIKIRATHEKLRTDSEHPVLEIFGAADLDGKLQQCRLGARVKIERTDEIQKVGAGDMVIYIVEEDRRTAPRLEGSIGRAKKAEPQPW